MRTWEACEMQDNPGRGHELMEIAGREVAQHLLMHYPDTHEALVFCGQGNNGGHGLVAAFYLSRCSVRVHLFVFDDAVSKTPDARSMFERVKSLPRSVIREASDAGKILEWTHRRNVVVIDAIYGTGYRPSHNGLMTRVYQCIEALDCPVISVDIASGIDASTGYRGLSDDPTPPKALVATETITFGAPKIGHFCGEGPTHTGELYCVDIGLAPYPGKGARRMILSDEYCDLQFSDGMRRGLDVHKGKCGHVLIIGGDESMPGASCLSARGALRAGCGLVTIGAKHIMRAPDEIMVSPILTDAQQLDKARLSQLMERASCMIIGPGLGRDDLTFEILNHCRTYKGCLILDADALWTLAKSPMEFAATEIFLTPHPGEASALCNCSVQEILFEPEKAARDIAEKNRATVILKGHTTWIVSKPSKVGNSRIGVSPYPNPDVVSAGIGDVLSGMIGGFAAQARSGALKRWFDAFEIACIAVNKHSRAGRKATAKRGPSTCASDLLDQI
jgi:NAD(P)H-hydrate epimerase